METPGMFVVLDTKGNCKNMTRRPRPPHGPIVPMSPRVAGGDGGSWHERNSMNLHEKIPKVYRALPAFGVTRDCSSKSPGSSYNCRNTINFKK